MPRVAVVWLVLALVAASPGVVDADSSLVPRVHPTGERDPRGPAVRARARRSTAPARHRSRCRRSVEQGVALGRRAEHVEPHVLESTGAQRELPDHLRARGRACRHRRDSRARARDRRQAAAHGSAPGARRERRTGRPGSAGGPERAPDASVPRGRPGHGRSVGRGARAADRDALRGRVRLRSELGLAAVVRPLLGRGDRRAIGRRARAPPHRRPDLHDLPDRAASARRAEPRAISRSSRTCCSSALPCARATCSTCSRSVAARPSCASRSRCTCACVRFPPVRRQGFGGAVGRTSCARARPRRRRTWTTRWRCA